MHPHKTHRAPVLAQASGSAGLATACGLLCLAVTGCSTPVLTSAPASHDKGPAVGLVYALPKAQVHLEVVRKQVDPDAVAKARKAAQAAVEASESASKDKEEAAGAVEEAAGIAKYAIGEGRPRALAQLDLARAKLKLRSAAAAEAEKAVERTARALATALEQPADFEQTITLSALPSAPDPQARFAVQLDRISPSRDQNIKLAVNNGLLHSSGVSSTGQLGAVMVSLASTVAGLGAAPVPFMDKALGKPSSGKDAPPPCLPGRQVFVFDPTSKSETDAVRKDLMEGLELAVSPPSSQAPAGATTLAASGAGGPVLDGLVYRAPMPITVSVFGVEDGHGGDTPADAPRRRCTGKVRTQGAALAATVPDPRQQYVLPVDANSFTTAKTDITFSEGMPLTYASEQPSQLAAIARIPVDMLKAVFSVPAEIFKLRIDYSSQKATLTEREAAELEAKIKLLEAAQALKDKESATGGSGTPGQP